MGLGAVSGTVDRAIEDIVSLLNSPQKRDEILRRARTYVSDNHKAESVVRAFEAALN